MSNVINPEALLNLLRVPHGRRMVCAMLNLGMQDVLDEAPDYFALRATFKRLRPPEQDDFKRMFHGPPDDNVTPAALKAMLRSGLIPDESITPDSPLFSFFRGAMLARNLDADGIPPSVLASPALSKSAIEAILSGGRLSSEAKTAISCNRNFDNRHFVPVKNPGIIPRILATYGDFSDADVVKTLMTEEAMMHRDVTNVLCSRNDLPKELAEMILDYGVDAPEDIDVTGDYPFGRTIGGQAIIAERMKGAFHFRQYESHDHLKLSPVLSADVIEKLYACMNSADGAEITDWKSGMAALVALPNAPNR